jgi:prepilin-type N-terminal cleavage/methylation domain-containing protein
MRIRSLFIGSQRGDTLIEVLISILVVSTVLGAAYATTTRNVQIGREAQERSNALKLAEAQLEQLKAIAKTDPDLIFATGAPASLCVNNAGAVVQSSDSTCQVGTSGMPTVTQPVFSLAATKTGTDSHTILITCTWDKFGRKGTNTLELRYRLY